MLGNIRTPEGRLQQLEECQQLTRSQLESVSQQKEDPMSRGIALILAYSMLEKDEDDNSTSSDDGTSTILDLPGDPNGVHEDLEELQDMLRPNALNKGRATRCCIKQVLDFWAEVHKEP
jgi:hypothetical protein